MATHQPRNYMMERVSSSILSGKESYLTSGIAQKPTAMSSINQDSYTLNHNSFEDSPKIIASKGPYQDDQTLSSIIVGNPIHSLSKDSRKALNKLLILEEESSDRMDDTEPPKPILEL